MALPVLKGEAVGPKCRVSRVGLPQTGSMPQCANGDGDEGLAKQAGWWPRVLPSRVVCVYPPGTPGLSTSKPHTQVPPRRHAYSSSVLKVRRPRTRAAA